MTTPHPPKPGPRPGVVAGGVSRPTAPTPTAQPAARPAVTIPAASDPAEWGRVDESGNAYVKTTDGERLIGSWQAGTPAEGLAHYGARFDDLVVEGINLETRLQSHPTESAHLRGKAEQLRDSLDEAAVIGDVESLRSRLTKFMDEAIVAGERAKEEKQARRQAAIARKEELAAEAEDIAENSTEWKQAGDRIRAILDEWRTIRGVDRKTDDALWKRYSRARDSFNRRRGAHFAELDRGRASAQRVKEGLVAQAEAIKDSTDWNETARAFRELMDRWRQAGRAPRDMDDKLWNAFKAAQDHFFDARNAEHEKRDQEFAANAAAKEALLAEYGPAIESASSADVARAKLRELQEKWEEIGFVPRGRVREFEDKIFKLESLVSRAVEDQWRRTDPEAQARAAQFTAKVKEFTAAAEAAEAKGKTKDAQKFREQAAQWQEWADAAIHAVESR